MVCYPTAWQVVIGLSYHVSDSAIYHLIRGSIYLVHNASHLQITIQCLKFILVTGPFNSLTHCAIELGNSPYPCFFPVVI